jgi:TetR/AcrR family transcriptional repressor of nem operon
VSKTDTRSAIVAVASELLRVNGYNGTGLDAVLKRAKVPKGSFYYYFPSKDDLGLAIIDQAAAELALKLDHHLGDAKRKPLRRLRSYFEASIEAQRLSDCTRGCLFGTLGLELASQNARLRERVAAVFKDWETRVAACLREAQKAGEIPPRLVATELAAFILNAWEGALLRTKIVKTVAPLTLFVDQLFRRVLRP